MANCESICARHIGQLVSRVLQLAHVHKWRHGSNITLLLSLQHTTHAPVCVPPVIQMQHNATHCSTLQHTHHTATHCNTLQHTARHCNNLQHTATYCNNLQHTARHCKTLQDTARHGTTLQHTTLCNTPNSTDLMQPTLQHTVTYSNAHDATDRYLDVSHDPCTLMCATRRMDTYTCDMTQPYPYAWTGNTYFDF